MKQVVTHGNSFPTKTKTSLHGFQRRLSKYVDKMRNLSITIQTTDTTLREAPAVVCLEKTIERNHHV